MNSRGSEIIRADQPVRTDLSLHAEIPLIDVGVLHRLRIYRIRSTKWEQRIAESNRKRIASRRPEPRRELHPSVVAEFETRNPGIARKLKAGWSCGIGRTVHAAIERRLVEER